MELAFYRKFLRIGILVSLLPLFGIVYVLLFNKKSMTYRNYILIFVLFCSIVFNFISPNLNKEYKEWLQYNKARTYFVDLKGYPKKNTLSQDETFLARNWWAEDDTLLSTEKVISTARTVPIATVQALYKSTKSFKHFVHVIIDKIYTHKLIIFLVIFTLYLIYKESKIYNKVFYLIFMVGFFLVIILRDHDRVTFPIMILWSILVFLKLYEQQTNLFSKIFLFVTIPMLIDALPINRIVNKDQNEKLKTEFIQLTQKYPQMKYEVSTVFPRLWLSDIDEVFKQSHLFDEGRWMHCTRNSIMLSSWIARHPYFYKFHNISFKEQKRKYNSYYEFLLDKNTGFIGTIKPEEQINNTILKMYDEKHSDQENCHHSIKVLCESEHFSLTQLTKKCDN